MPTATNGPVSITVQVADTSSPTQHATATLSIQIEQPDSGTSSVGLYNFQIQASGGGSGYDPVSNVTGYTDSVMGAWNFTYDTLHRLSTGSQALAGVAFPNYCWSYDAFGNRTTQVSAVSAFTASSGGPSPCQTPGAIGQTVWTNPDANNRIVASSAAPGGFVYDASGDVTYDGLNQYLYDAEGHVCAVQQSVNGTTSMTGYVYDAEGNRVAKGTITSWSCDPTVNGFATTTDYILGAGGETMTEVASDSQGGMTSQRTYVYASGQNIAVYDKSGLHFRLTDWLGTLRVTTGSSGLVESTCSSLPFGDTEACTGPTDTHHFTGKERDTESGNDYFGARYYANSMGRWLSPDWSAKPISIPYADLDDPQTLNLYAYVRNNPLSDADKDGHQHLGCSTVECAQKMEADVPPEIRAEIKRVLNHPAVQGYLDVLTFGSISGIEESLAGKAAVESAETLAARAGTLTTLGEASRLSTAELSTGERLATQTGLQLKESTHVGAEFVDSLGKTYDAMGQPAAYSHWNEGQFFNSITDHLNKSVDYVAIDLKGASKDQVGAIKSFVGNLPKPEQARIKYVN